MMACGGRVHVYIIDIDIKCIWIATMSFRFVRILWQKIMKS